MIFEAKPGQEKARTKIQSFLEVLNRFFNLIVTTARQHICQRQGRRSMLSGAQHVVPINPTSRGNYAPPSPNARKKTFRSAPLLYKTLKQDTAAEFLRANAMPTDYRKRTQKPGKFEATKTDFSHQNLQLLISSDSWIYRMKYYHQHALNSLWG